MGNMKFVAELMKLTSDVEERKAGVRIAAEVGCITYHATEAAKRLVRKLAGDKATIFDHVERFDESEMDLMMTIVSRNGSKAEQTEASDVEQTMTPPARVVSPAGATALPGMEGTIKPKPKIRVKHDTATNRVRLWILQDVPKGALITVKEVNRMFNLDHGSSCSIIDSLLEDRAIRRKRNITGSFQKGTYVRMGKASDATLKKRLRGKRIG